MFTTTNRPKRVVDKRSSLGSYKQYSNRKSASVKLNRIHSQVKKKLKKGSTSDLIGTVQSEIGWLGLCIMATCLIALCWIVLLIVYSGDKPGRQTLDELHPKHPGHSSQYINPDVPLDYVDVEGWSANQLKDRRAPNKGKKKPGFYNRKGHKNKNENNNVVTDMPKSKPIDGENWKNIVDYISTIELPMDTPKLTQAILDEKIYAIKHSFLHAWHGYAKHAMGHDEIQPVSDVPGDSWGGLGATLIDGLDTMMLMEIKDEFNEALMNLLKIDFNSNIQVSFFETTIRHLGGLIGAYEVSKIFHKENKDILNKGIELIDNLLPAFNTEVGIPKSMVNLQTKEIKNYGWTNDRSVLSEIGSNQLEFYIMSKYSNNNNYFKVSNNVYNLLHNMSKPDGLYGRLIDYKTGQMPTNEKVYTIGGMSDSFYEYLLKLWIVTGYKHKKAIKMFVESMDMINEKLLKKVTDNNRREIPYFFYGELWYNKFKGKLEELDCFIPGLIALSAYHIDLRYKNSQSNGDILTEYELKLYKNKDIYLKLAHLLTESCYQLYNEMPTGLAPESIEFDDTYWKPKEMRYQLRPETLESLYIMYTITGKEIYREWSWNIYTNIEKYCKTSIAYSGIKDVSAVPSEQDNKMESYVMAETFKYLYLTFNDPISKLIPFNKYVFNTEAHPIKINDNENNIDIFK